VKNLTVFCGGCSTEHDITLLSAQNVIRSVDQSCYALTIIYISPSQGWFRLRQPEAMQVLVEDVDLSDRSLFEPLAVAFDNPQAPWVSLSEPGTRYPVDVVFPVLHGTYGEDGCIQGLLTLLKIPYVGADTLTSALLMNKIRTKQVLQHAGVPCVPYQAWMHLSEHEAEAREAFHDFGGDVFIKAANLGSSVGVLHVQSEAELQAAFAEVFRYDEWLMMEPTVTGREIEVAVLGNRGNWQVAGPGEIVKNNGFYSYAAKYVDAESAQPLAKTEVTEAERENIYAVAKAVAQAVHCEGMCRVDGFLTPDQGFVINEVNTIPGFTDISLYPGMWQHAGKPTTELLNDLLGLACQRHERLNRLERSYR
jgi:D-alanine-D-alanine ligase